MEIYVFHTFENWNIKLFNLESLKWFVFFCMDFCLGLSMIIFYYISRDLGSPYLSYLGIFG